MPKHPSEVFGYAVTDRSPEAEAARERFWCPFVDDKCNKRSRLIDYPMGVCSVQYGDDVVALSPRRFRQDDIVFRDIALEYFGDVNNLVVFPEVGLKGIGNFDFVMVKHPPFSAQVSDFVVIEFQTGQTTGTGKLVRALVDFMGGEDVVGKTYRFGLNTYDIWKRAFTQVLNKGLVLEHWGHKIFWVVQDRIFTNLQKRYNLEDLDYNRQHSTVFAIYDLIEDETGYTLERQEFLSATVEHLFDAFRNNPNLPKKEAFVRVLNSKLEANMQLRLGLED